MPRTRSLAWSELKLGIAGLVAAGLAILIILAVGGQAGFFWQRYPLKARFHTVQGLKSGAVVRLNGKEVGSVTNIEFSGQDIEVAMQITKGVQRIITTDSTATIGSLSLLGEPIIDLTASGTGTPLADWAFVPTVPGGSAFDRLTNTASQGLSDISGLLADIRNGRGTLGKLVTDETVYNELRQFIDSANDVVTNVQRGKGTLGQLAKNPAAYQSLKASLENLRLMTDRLNRGEGSLGRLLTDETFSRSATSAARGADEMLGNLNRGQGTAGKLLTDDQLYSRLNDLSARVNGLAQGLDEGRGTAGHLLRDEQLYDNLNKAAAELRGLIADIRKDPKKYLNVKMSIF